MNSPFPPLILLAPNAFKGCLAATEIARILAVELRECGLRTLQLPQGDGGDGTAAIVANYLGAQLREIHTTDALGRPRVAHYYRNADTAIIELAEICGIKYLKRNEYDILCANTKGFGQVIDHAVREGVCRLLLCIGGSASVDGGLGALLEMGLQLDGDFAPYSNPLIHFQQFNSDQLQEKYKHVDCTILCDVDNPVCGPEGAAAVFGPQKGASPEQVTLLDSRLTHLTRLLEMHTGTSLFHLKHGGAAGGIALSLHALIGAKLVSGSEYCLALSGFHHHLTRSFAVVTGEGKIDRQTLSGKIPGIIARLCHDKRIPVYAVAGTVVPSLQATFTQVFALKNHASSIEDSIRHAKDYLRLVATPLSDAIYDAYYSK